MALRLIVMRLVPRSLRIGEQIMVREIDTVIGAAQSDMSAFGLAELTKLMS